jgi:hypothetical protein
MLHSVAFVLLVALAHGEEQKEEKQQSLEEFMAAPEKNGEFMAALDKNGDGKITHVSRDLLRIAVCCDLHAKASSNSFASQDELVDLMLHRVIMTVQEHRKAHLAGADESGAIAYEKHHDKMTDGILHLCTPVYI